MDPNETRMNLAALKRIDPYIESIRASASQVALYSYKAQVWEKTDKEGSLFVYERMCSPKYGVLILNRLSTTNWVQPVTSGADSQLQVPFLLYKNREGDVFGIWFYVKQQCEIVTDCIKSLIAEVGRDEEGSGASSNAPPKDLGSLLANARGAGKVSDPSREEVDDDQSRKLLQLVKGKGADGHGHPQQPQSVVKPLQRQGPPGLAGHQGRAQPASATEEQSNSVLKFFAEASQHQQALVLAGPVVGASGPPPVVVGGPTTVPLGLPAPLMAQQGLVPGVPPNIPFLNTLFSNSEPEPSAPSVPVMPPLPKEATSACDLESDLKNKLNVQGSKNNGGGGGGHVINAGNISSSRKSSKQKQQQPLTHHQQQQQQQLRKQELENQKMSYAAVASPGKGMERPAAALNSNRAANPALQQQQQNRKSHPLKALSVGKAIPASESAGSGYGQLQQKDDPEDAEEANNQLLSPMVFAQPVLLSDSAIMGMSSKAVEDGGNGCMNGGGNRMMPAERETITPMTEQQLLQAFQYLLRTDPLFVGKLHRAYVESMNIKLQ